MTMRRIFLLASLLLVSCSPAYAGALGCAGVTFSAAILGALALLCAVLAGGFIDAGPTTWRAYLPTAVMVAVIIVLALVSPTACADSIPDACKNYRRDLVRLAHTEMGIDAPTATLFAQMHQESRCNAKARSPVGAEGLAQTMPGTAAWLSRLHKELAHPQPLNPIWSMRSMVVYDVWHLERLQARGPCDKWAFAMAAYNGGLGWIQKDKQLASSKGDDPLAWFNSVERHNSGRSAANFKESRGYPRNILLRWEPMYVRAGWGKGVCT